MRNRLCAASLAVLLVVSACGVVGGSGKVETETRQVSGFTAIDLTGTGEVTIEQGETESLTIEADDNVLPALTSKVSAQYAPNPARILPAAQQRDEVLVGFHFACIPPAGRHEPGHSWVVEFP